jgi:hypothetical protein
MMLYKVNTLVVHYKQKEHMVFIVVAGNISVERIVLISNMVSPEP